VQTYIGGPQLKNRCMPNEHRPRYRVQKYVIAIHSLIGVNLFRKLCGGSSSAEGTGMEPRKAPTRMVSGEGVYPLKWGGVWAPRKISGFCPDFVLQNVELLCILDSGAGR